MKVRLTLCRVKEISLQMVKLTLWSSLWLKHVWLMGRMMRIVAHLVLICTSVTYFRL